MTSDVLEVRSKQGAMKQIRAISLFPEAGVRWPNLDWTASSGAEPEVWPQGPMLCFLDSPVRMSTRRHPSDGRATPVLRVRWPPARLLARWRAPAHGHRVGPRPVRARLLRGRLVVSAEPLASVHNESVPLLAREAQSASTAELHRRGRRRCRLPDLPPVEPG